jgi:hypothetical protein
MPTRVGHDLTALRDDRPSGRCVALAEALGTVSHDRLTRRRQGDWSGHTRLDGACRTRCIWERGVLLLDDTVLPHPFATAREGLAGVFSSQERRPGYGFSLVLLVGTAGSLRVPLGVRRWHQGGPSKEALAFAWLSPARHPWHGRAASVLVAAGYPSKALRKRRRDDGW